MRLINFADLFNQEESKSGSLHIGCEKGLKEMGLIFLRNANAIIVNCEGGIAGDLLKCEGDFKAFRRHFWMNCRVINEIADYLMEVIAIEIDPFKALINIDG